MRFEFLNFFNYRASLFKFTKGRYMHPYYRGIIAPKFFAYGKQNLFPALNPKGGFFVERSHQPDSEGVKGNKYMIQDVHIKTSCIANAKVMII
ncbi:MAG: hypothetical protein BWY70_01698 [Bacteroidetes bacterium ADurb.Bin408]|nr:MAG: hypothetical protein BWY70_01698 [Bacteroidetes bacterium ADurb.Bin408]